MIRIALLILSALAFPFGASAVPTQETAGNTTPSQPQSALSSPSASFTLDTPIRTLAADPRVRVVLDRELPGLTTHARYEQFKGMSLKALKPLSGGMITDQRLAAVEASLKALAPSAN